MASKPIDKKKLSPYVAEEVVRQLKDAASTLVFDRGEMSDAEYEATVEVVWRGLGSEVKDWLMDTLDGETGPWQLWNGSSVGVKVAVAVETQGGYIPEYHAPSSRHGIGLRYAAERLRLQRFLRTVVNGDEQARSRLVGCKK